MMSLTRQKVVAMKRFRSKESSDEFLPYPLETLGP